MSRFGAAKPLDIAAGRRVHLLMWDRRITQVELGRSVGMDQSSLGKRLRGERGWSLDQLATVAGALNTTIAYLVGEIDDPSCAPRDLNPEPIDTGLELAEIISIDAAPRYREKVTA